VKTHRTCAQETEKYFKREPCIDEKDMDDERVGKRAIYLVFSFAPASSMARAIIAYTEGSFSHVAIALDGSLTNMYSFTITRGNRFSKADSRMKIFGIIDYNRYLFR